MDRTKLVMKWVKCFRLDVETIFDTGAVICVISPQLCSKLSIKTKSSWKRGQILTANGTRIIPEGSAELVPMIDGQRIRIEAAVLEMNGFDLLLGNDALRKLGSIKIDYVNDGPAVLSTGFDVGEVKGELYQMVCNESRSIPALSMIMLAVEGRGKASSNEISMVKPNVKVMLDKGLSVSWVILPSEGIPATMQLLNFSTSRQWIAEETVLGQIVGVKDVMKLT